MAERYFPFPGFFLPFCADDFGVEGHVFAETENFDHLQEVLVNVGGIREEAGPVGIKGEVIGVCVGGNVTGAALYDQL